ncbi:flavin reductase family protein, partial [Arthrobacter bambusae]|nr:flavin reductase family protein [Arthrobacter bambusae]
MNNTRTPEQVTELDPNTPQLFRSALGQFASGVVVITGLTDGQQPAGMTCQSFSSLSLEPPLIMFSPSLTSTSFPQLRAAGNICINVLAENQDHVSGQFAVRNGDKWKDIDWTPGANGAPRIAGAAMWCEGTIQTVHDAGDHHIVVVQVSALA